MLAFEAQLRRDESGRRYDPVLIWTDLDLRHDRINFWIMGWVLMEAQRPELVHLIFVIFFFNELPKGQVGKKIKK